MLGTCHKQFYTVRNMSIRTRVTRNFVRLDRWLSGWTRVTTKFVQYNWFTMKWCTLWHVSNHTSVTTKIVHHDTWPSLHVSRKFVQRYTCHFGHLYLSAPILYSFTRGKFDTCKYKFCTIVHVPEQMFYGATRVSVYLVHFNKYHLMFWLVPHVQNWTRVTVNFVQYNTCHWNVHTVWYVSKEIFHSSTHFKEIFE